MELIDIFTYLHSTSSISQRDMIAINTKLLMITINSQVWPDNIPMKDLLTLFYGQVANGVSAKNSLHEHMK